MKNRTPTAAPTLNSTIGKTIFSVSRAPAPFALWTMFCEKANEDIVNLQYEKIKEQTEKVKDCEKANVLDAKIKNLEEKQTNLRGI